MNGVFVDNPQSLSEMGVAFRVNLVYPKNWRESGVTSRGSGVTACYIMNFLFTVCYMQRRTPFLLHMHKSLTVSYEIRNGSAVRLWRNPSSLLFLSQVATQLLCNLKWGRLPVPHLLTLTI